MVGIDAMERQRLTSDSRDASSPRSSSGEGVSGRTSIQANSGMSKCKRIVINMANGRTKQGHRCTVECLTRYPIHHAARLGRFKDLKTLLEQYKPSNATNSSEGEPTEATSAATPLPPNPPTPSAPLPCCPLEKDECLGRTPLHYAACTGNVVKGLRCVRLLLECSAVNADPAKRTEKLRKFVNSTDYNNDTALHLATRNEATSIVKELLMNQADLEIQSYIGSCGLREIYKRTPLAMDDAMNQSISYEEFCRRDMGDGGDNEESGKSTSSDEIDFTQSYISVCLNFYPLLGSGVWDKNGNPKPETTFLYQINRKRMLSEERRQILNNVLVQAFLHFKWNKIKIFCYFAIFLHIIWLALYIGIVIDVFVINCPYLTTGGKKLNGNPNNNHSDSNNLTDQSDHNFTSETFGECQINTTVHFASALLLMFSVGIAIKEFFQFVRLRSLYIRFENLGQCMLLTFIFVSIPSLYLTYFSVISPLHYQLSAFGIFLAWTLFLCQLAKLPRFCMHIRFFRWRGSIVFPDHGIYVEILSRVFKNFLVFITIFSSLLISFVFSFNILLPNSTGFINLSNSVLKVLTMMTGELNYDDIFHSEDEEEQLIYPVSSHVMYAIFIMVATIILFNLLIGFTVSDIQGLQKDAEVNQISNKLEQIFLMECFLLSMPMKVAHSLFTKVFTRNNSRKVSMMANIMVTRWTARHTWLCFHTKIKQLPKQHRVEIRDWASKNCLTIADIYGVQRSNLFQSSFTRHPST